MTLTSTPRQVCESVDLLGTATSATDPLIHADWLTPDLHITAALVVGVVLLDATTHGRGPNP